MEKLTKRAQTLDEGLEMILEIMMGRNLSKVNFEDLEVAFRWITGDKRKRYLELFNIWITQPIPEGVDKITAIKSLLLLLRTGNVRFLRLLKDWPTLTEDNSLYDLLLVQSCIPKLSPSGKATEALENLKEWEKKDLDFLKSKLEGEDYSTATSTKQDNNPTGGRSKRKAGEQPKEGVKQVARDCSKSGDMEEPNPIWKDISKLEIGEKDIFLDFIRSNPCPLNLVSSTIKNSYIVSWIRCSANAESIASLIRKGDHLPSIWPTINNTVVAPKLKTLLFREQTQDPEIMLYRDRFIEMASRDLTSSIARNLRIERESSESLSNMIEQMSRLLADMKTQQISRGEVSLIPLVDTPPVFHPTPLETMKDAPGTSNIAASWNIPEDNAPVIKQLKY